ncbi:hypothetical protein ACIRQH_03755 [Streptomyces sp. NPDC102279]|uniref:hypothetical protein n=1 Tax=Streptomyces sp. NPDC102279 TaxID=3366153 RepID=UPI0037FB03A3
MSSRDLTVTNRGDTLDLLKLFVPAVLDAGGHDAPVLDVRIAGALHPPGDRAKHPSTLKAEIHFQRLPVSPVCEAAHPTLCRTWSLRSDRSTTPRAATPRRYGWPKFMGHDIEIEELDDRSAEDFETPKGGAGGTTPVQPVRPVEMHWPPHGV